MMNITIAGNIGRDAELRRTQTGETIASFPVAVAGIGRDAPSTWFDVSMFGKRGEALAPMLAKGGFVCVSGRFGTRVHEGKTYLQVNASEVTLGPKRADAGEAPARSRNAAPAKAKAAPDADAFDDPEIPF